MRSGGLFAGYGGLDMAVAEVFGAEPAWFSEIEDAPSKILAHHWPDVPNHGDITKIDWDKVEPVDILSGGFPWDPVRCMGRPVPGEAQEVREAVARRAGGRMTGMRYSDTASSLQTEYDAEIDANPPLIEWKPNGKGVMVGTVIEDPHRDGNHNKSKTHCKRNHPLDEGNTISDHGYRRCRTCKNERRRAA